LWLLLLRNGITDADPIKEVVMGLDFGGFSTDEPTDFRVGDEAMA
jgi:hypothetical protein